MMKIRQYCYFALKSETLSAGEITARLRMEPDEVAVMGSRRPKHGVARRHMWKIVDHSTDSIDEQIQHLVDRLNPIQSGLISLVTTTNVISVMQVVRYFHDPEGAHDAPLSVSWEETLQWPQPLGWHLPLPVLNFLSSTGIELDIDEYDLSDDDDTYESTAQFGAGHTHGISRGAANPHRLRAPATSGVAIGSADHR